jgi:hypothetical protein
MVVGGQRYALDGCAEENVPCFHRHASPGPTVQLVAIGYPDPRIFRVHKKQNS